MAKKEQERSPELRGESATSTSHGGQSPLDEQAASASLGDQPPLGDQAEEADVESKESTAAAPVLDSKDTAAAAPTEQPKGEGKPKTAKSKKEDTPAEKQAKGHEELVKEYSKLYPKNKVFYVTSDRTVFLQHARNEAVNHQRTLEGGAVAEVDRID